MPEAIGQFRRVVDQEPNYVKAHTSLASALAETGETDQAIRHYREAISIRPKHAEAHFRLGQILLGRDRLPQAEEHLSAAVQADPQAPRFHFFLGRTLAKQNKLDRAVEQYRKEIAVFPNNPLPYVELAAICLARGDADSVERAIDHYSRAVDLDPTLVPALNNLAWIYATGSTNTPRNGNRAVLLAERAAELTGNSVPQMLDTLAAAYAEVGQFDRAVQTVRKALALAEEANNAGLADQIRSRLDLYRAGKPFRDPPP